MSLMSDKSLPLSSSAFEVSYKNALYKSTVIIIIIQDVALSRSESFTKSPNNTESCFRIVGL